MTLNFPNQSRSYDAVRKRIRFWGYDSALEIAFFVDAGALHKLAPEAEEAEAGLLAAFDTRVERIHAVASKVYTRHRQGAYVLAASDF